MPWHIAVPAEVVLDTISVLRCYVATWEPPAGLEPGEQAVTTLAATAAGALFDLLDAYAAHNHQGGARALVEQIDGFLQQRDIRACLEELRDQRQSGDIVEALLALHARRLGQPTLPPAP